MGINVWYPDPAARYVICTSASRPTGDQRITGMMIYETDTQITRVWNGSGWLPAGNSYPRTYQTGLGGGTTSGVTELVIGTLVIPAQPIATQVIPTFQPRGTFAGTADRFLFAIRDSAIGGLGRAASDTGIPAAVGSRSGPLIQGVPFTLAANVSHTLVGTVQRIGGSTGTFQVTGGTEFSYLSATVLADWTVTV